MGTAVGSGLGVSDGAGEGGVAEGSGEAVPVGGRSSDVSVGASVGEAVLVAEVSAGVQPAAKIMKDTRIIPARLFITFGQLLL